MLCWQPGPVVSRPVCGVIVHPIMVAIGAAVR
jgi:hypothetical protein